MLYDGIMANDDAPATKADLNRLEEKLGADLNQLAEQLRSEFQHGFDHLAESIHDSETRLLKAFYTFAQSTDAKRLATRPGSDSPAPSVALPCS